MEYHADPRFTGAGNDERLAQARDSAWRGTFQQGLDTWLAGRQNYASGLSQASVASQAPGAAIAYRDDRRDAAFKSARTGTKGGSADAARRGSARAAYAQRMAQIMAGGIGIEQTQRGNDMERAMQLRQESYQSPGRDASRQATLARFGTQAGNAATLGQLEAQRNAVNAQFDQDTAKAMSAWMPS